MLIIRRNTTDPFFNLAAEEYVLKNFDEDTFALWRNDKSIIVGKHQNTLAEINQEYVSMNDIKVVRRLSGGGAVFHDLGNLNFTFTQTSQDENLINFRKYTQPILDVLQLMGVNALFEGRNDLTINGKKFSGNAMHIWKNKVLHHGTLLFSAEIPDLTSALNADPSKFEDKAVKSVRSRVTNIQEHLNEEMDVMQFADRIETFIVEQNPDATLYELSSKDIGEIQKLRDSKYATWEWNFGYSPKYNFKKVIRTGGSGTIEINLDVHDGVIQQVKFYGDYFGILDSEEIEKSLVGTGHRKESVDRIIRSFDLSKYFANLSPEELIPGFF
ncbi:MAG: lipoate--protein ligase [Bacteroidales bacterium]|nr:lipoate--protein ligase [Bacteroidales bacterium]